MEDTSAQSITDSKDVKFSSKNGSPQPTPVTATIEALVSKLGGNGNVDFVDADQGLDDMDVDEHASRKSKRQRKCPFVGGYIDAPSPFIGRESHNNYLVPASGPGYSATVHNGSSFDVAMLRDRVERFEQQAWDAGKTVRTVAATVAGMTVLGYAALLALYMGTGIVANLRK